MDVIVVASSEAGVQKSLKALLGGEHVLAPASTLAELLNALVEQPVDVVILDEFLENVDCASVYNRLRSLAPETTCIMLTTRAGSETVREMRGKGIYDVVSMPFDKDELIASVDRALERSRFAAKLAVADTRRVAPPADPAPTPADDSAILQRRWMLDSLRKFLKATTDALEPERLYELVLEAVVELFSIHRATLLLSDTKTGRMKPVASVGFSRKTLNAWGAASWDGIGAWLRERQQILDLDGPDAPAHSEEAINVRKELKLLQSRMCAPLVTDGRLVGALAVGNRLTGKRLSDSEIEFFCLLSQQIAAIVESAGRRRDVFAQKEKFQEILQGVNSGLFATDSQGRLLVFNKTAEQILGLDASQVLGKSVQRIGSVFADIVFRSLREEKSLCRHEVVDPATKALLGISTSLLTDADGSPIGAVALFTDLSTVSSRASGASEEMWRRCALCLAQEIRHPLVAIRTFAQLAPSGGEEDKSRDEFAEIAIKEIDRLNAVVERLVQFAQPLVLTTDKGDINALLDEELEKAAEALGSREIELKKDFQFVNGGIPFDRNLMKEAFGQILSNALEAMPSGGTLNVSTAEAVYPAPKTATPGNGVPSGPAAEIKITDTGVGIPPKDIPDLFKPFHTNKLRGMGLGLPISRRIIREHNGDITVSSELDKGTTVKITLPYGVNEDE